MGKKWKRILLQRRNAAKQGAVEAPAPVVVEKAAKPVVVEEAAEDDGGHAAEGPPRQGLQGRRPPAEACLPTARERSRVGHRGRGKDNRLLWNGRRREIDCARTKLII